MRQYLHHFVRVQPAIAYRNRARCTHCASSRLLPSERTNKLRIRRVAGLHGHNVTANPPTLMFVPVNKRDGTKKDTVRNIEEVPEFVVNLVSAAVGERMNETSAMLPYGESEFERFAISSAASARVRPPRIAPSSRSPRL